MRSTLAAAAVAALLTAAAQANVVVNIPGSFTISGSHGYTVTTGAMTGTLTGIRVHFTYQYVGGSSLAQDVAFTVNQHQWGGYQPFINDASMGECPTGAPEERNTITYTSSNLGIGYGVPLASQPLLVGFGNGNIGGTCTISDVSVTLLGVVPTPGAAAALGLGGLAGLRRRRRV